MATKKKKKKASPQPLTSNQTSVAADLAIKPPKAINIGDPNLTEDEQVVVTAVRKFQQAETMLRLFAEDPQTKPIMDAYRELVEDYNQKQKLADSLVRSVGVTCGPFQLHSQVVSYDAEALYKHLGKAQFTDAGGTIVTQTVYEIDKEKIEIAIALNKIPKEVVLDVRTVSNRYHKPDKSK